MPRLASNDPTPVPPKTPRPKRPARNVLATKTVCLKRKLIYERNSELSSLLSLPPEIRNRIWSLVLGGLTIHVSRNYSNPTSILSRSICQTPEPDYDRTIAIRSESTATRHQSLEQSHETCSGNKDTLGWRLALLSVCRQIHDESALLPYSDNHYSFIGLSALENFLRTIIHAQGSAIRSITYVRRTHVARDSKTQVASDKTWFLRKLSGVTSVICFVEFARDWRVEAFNAEEERRKLEAARVLLLERLPLKAATVAAYSTLADGSLDEQSSEDLLSCDEARNWEEELERQMMTVADDGETQRTSEQRVLKKEAKAVQCDEERRQRRTRNRTSGGRLRSHRLLESDLKNLILNNNKAISGLTKCVTVVEPGKRRIITRASVQR